MEKCINDPLRPAAARKEAPHRLEKPFDLNLATNLAPSRVATYVFLKFSHAQCFGDEKILRSLKDGTLAEDVAREKFRKIMLEQRAFEDFVCKVCFWMIFEWIYSNG